MFTLNNNKILSTIVLCLILFFLTSCGSFFSGNDSEEKNSNNNANLLSLTLSSGVLSPSFELNITEYTAEVSNSAESIILTPVSEDTNASIVVNDIACTSGAESQSIALDVGINDIEIKVTAENGYTEKIYTVAVIRLAGLSSNANLASLTLSSGTLTPEFSTDISDYTTEVPNEISTITVSPTAAGVNASIAVNGEAVVSGSSSQALALAVGVNSVTVAVTAEDGIANKTYNISVTRQVSVITVEIPSNLVANAESVNIIRLTWQDNSNNEDGFTIERSLDGIVFTLIDTTAANIVEYIDNSLVSSTFYYYRVKAYFGLYESGYSNIASDITFTEDTIDWCNLQWPTDVTINESDFFSIYGRVYRAGITDSGLEYNQIDAEAGYGPVGSNPNDEPWLWTWIPAMANTAFSDPIYWEYYAEISGVVSGVYDTCFRFQCYPSGPWLYGDTDGSPYEIVNAGKLTVTN